MENVNDISRCKEDERARNLRKDILALVQNQIDPLDAMPGRVIAISATYNSLVILVLQIISGVAPRYRVPFAPWKGLISGGAYSALPWWQAHNALKHDRLRHIREGTLRNAVDALCALHQVLCRRLDMVPFLLRRGWFPLAGYNPEFVLDAAAKGSLPETFVIQTALFAVPVGPQQFPELVANLQPFKYKCKIEFNAFLGKL